MDELKEKIARAMEPSAFETYDQGCMNKNFLEIRAFLNSEKVVKRARKKAQDALAALEDAGYAVVPRETRIMNVSERESMEHATAEIDTEAKAILRERVKRNSYSALSDSATSFDPEKTHCKENDL